MKLLFKHSYYLSCPPSPPTHRFEGCQELYLLGAPAPGMFSTLFTVPSWVIFGLSEMDGTEHTSPANLWQQLSEDRDRDVGCKTRSGFRQRKTFFASPCPGRLQSTLSLLGSLLSRQKRCGSQYVYSSVTPSV